MIEMTNKTIKKININDTCYVCKERPVKYRVSFTDGEATINLCVCDRCIELSQEEMLKKWGKEI